MQSTHTDILNESYVRSFIAKRETAILSTVNDKNLPCAAPIYYILEQNLEIWFITPTDTEKYRNMCSNKNIVLTVTDDQTMETVQIRGSAIEDVSLLEKAYPKLGKKLSDIKHDLVTLPVLKLGKKTKTVIRVIPEEIRFRTFQGGNLREFKLSI